MRPWVLPSGPAQSLAQTQCPALPIILVHAPFQSQARWAKRWESVAFSLLFLTVWNLLQLSRRRKKISRVVRMAETIRRGCSVKTFVEPFLASLTFWLCLLFYLISTDNRWVYGPTIGASLTPATSSLTSISLLSLQILCPSTHPPYGTQTTLS